MTKCQNKYQRSWTPARRAACAARARFHKPWRFSTGPKTAAGKSKVAQNGYKHGLHGVAFRSLKDALRCQNRFLRIIRHALKERRRLIRAQLKIQKYAHMQARIQARNSGGKQDVKNADDIYRL